MLVSESKGDTFHVQDLASGKAVEVATVADLPAGSDYAVGNFRGAPLREFVFYKPGANSLTVRPGRGVGAGEVPVRQGRQLRPGPADPAGRSRLTRRPARSCSSSSARARRPACSASMARRRRCWSRPSRPPTICSPAPPPSRTVSLPSPSRRRASSPRATRFTRPRARLIRPALSAVSPRSPTTTTSPFLTFMRASSPISR